MINPVIYSATQIKSHAFPWLLLAQGHLLPLFTTLSDFAIFETSKHIRNKFRTLQLIIYEWRYWNLSFTCYLDMQVALIFIILLQNWSWWELFLILKGGHYRNGRSWSHSRLKSKLFSTLTQKASFYSASHDVRISMIWQIICFSVK